MTNILEPGVWVEALHDCRMPDGVRKGRVYKCDDVHIGTAEYVCSACNTIDIVHVNVGQIQGCYCPCYFKPIYDGDTSIEDFVGEPQEILEDA